MSLPPELLRFRQHPIPVLDDGHVQLVDVMGDDLSVVDAARVSFFGKANDHTPKENRHLLRYMMSHGHTSPFEMCEIKLRVRVPMDVWRQWIRHRTASVNESSTRYAPAIDSARSLKADEWRLQSASNKQGSDGLLDPEVGKYLSAREASLHADIRDAYEERLEKGVAKEVARKDLPLSTYTEAYWKIDLHNLLNFLRLRLDSHAQYEIRQYAEAIASILKVWVPWTWEAFEDYVREAMTFSRMEVEALRKVLSYIRAHFPATPGAAEELPDAAISLITTLPKREMDAFEVKVRRLLED